VEGTGLTAEETRHHAHCYPMRPGRSTDHAALMKAHPPLIPVPQNTTQQYPEA